MRSTYTIGLLGIATAALLLSASRATPVDVTKKPVDFARDVRPILSEKCFACHGKDEKQRQAGLRLDLREAAVAKGASGHSPIVPGKPSASAVVARITATGPLKMPPVASGKKLSAENIAILKQWIAQGAKYAPHWAYIAPRMPQLPALPILNPKSKIQNQEWSRNPIDRFIIAKLTQNGLNPNPRADKFTLIRRVSLDLTGLPPTAQEVDAFINDSSKDAYEMVVDRLLESAHFGEKWARMWLDLARYADSAGYGSDPLRPNIWPWRDWVLNAFNKNMPYDQFTIEQLAGDLLPNPTKDQLIATAFHRNTMTNTEGGTDREEFRTAAVKDRTITTAQVWMGLTMGCAQCHSHKFDPITNKEFYRFMAFFNQTEDNDQPNETPTMPLPTVDELKKMDALKTEIAALEAKADPKLKEDIEKKKKELEAIKPVALPIMKELPADKQRETHVLILSNFLQKADKVEPATPVAFNPFPATAPKNRLGVAKWLVNKDNPLTARVAVNRFWAQLFGKGNVETEEDFGYQGQLPVNQELLDWLAVRFRDGGQDRLYSTDPWASSSTYLLASYKPWDIKALLKLIVTSETYKQTSTVTPAHLAKDPQNRLLARYPRRRLDAETVRDQALALSGMLSHKIGGPSVFPPQPNGMWQAAFNGERTYPTSTGEDRYRRGMYTFWRRTVPYPSMATFDAPSREICCMRRIPTNTPLQALVTLNDPVYLELAQAMGRRIVKEGGSSTEQRVRFSLRLSTAHPPSETQVQTLVRLYQSELARYKAQPDAAKKLAIEPLGALPAGMDVAEQAAWTVVSNVLLNLDGVLTNG
jgi:hypothetical protein